MKNVQNDMNVVLRNRNAIFISPFVAHIQQMSQKIMSLAIVEKPIEFLRLHDAQPIYQSLIYHLYNSEIGQVGAASISKPSR